MQQPNPVLSYLLPLAVAALVIAFRWRRMKRPRPLAPGRLWVLPVLYAALVAWLFAEHPPHGLAWLACAAALALGAALGWQRGRTIRITVHPETGTLEQTGSPLTLLFIAALVVARSGARAAMEARGVAIDPLAVADVLMALALGLIAAQRVEMYLRARSLLAVRCPGPPDASPPAAAPARARR